MSTFIVRDTDRGTERDCDSMAEAKETKDDMVALGAEPSNLEILAPGEHDYETQSAAEILAEETGRPQEDFELDENTDVPDVEELEAKDAKPVNPEDLSKDPIAFLRSVNDDFVNTIKGKPAISKQGFRFIQREFEISTESEVVQWIDEPLGCIVWAKAELPSGYSAEAHGEGYQFESDVRDNEFVRYADTRAKNRAISDLTSAGALAVSELQGEE